MKKVSVWLLLAAAMFGIYQQDPTRFSAYFKEPVTETATRSEKNLAAGGYQKRHHQQQITGSGKVIKLLADDNKGSRHQRFILRLVNGQTLLVAHNIDLAPYLKSVQVGDTVTFSGEYIWNDKGGILHWTHHDPKGRHPGGWLKHNNELYQ